MNKVHRAEGLTLVVTPLYLFKTMGGIFIRFPFFTAAGALYVVVFTDFHFLISFRNTTFNTTTFNTTTFNTSFSSNRCVSYILGIS